MNESKRKYYLDILRIFACLLVILMHSPSPNTVAQPSSFFLSGISYFTQPCIGLFFMVSGALLLPATATATEFLKRRLGRVLLPTVFWSAMYITLHQEVNRGGYDITMKSLMSIPFSAQGTGVLWFMYALIGFYLIIPIISPWLQKATSKEVLLYISLFLISTTYPFLKQIVNLDRSTSNILYYFASYGGYFLLGWYMARFGLRMRWRYLCLAYAAMLALPAVFLICGEREYFWQMINYLSLPVVIMSIFWFATAQRFSKAIDGLSERAKKVIARLSSLSFGVYLIHIAVMRYFIWNQSIIIGIPSHILQSFVIFALTTIISTILVWLISKLPFSKYIIG